MSTVEYVILGHQNPDVDSIVSGYLLEKYLNNHGYCSKFIIPDLKIDNENLIICRNYGLNPSDYQGVLPRDEDQKYILVDHFERDVPGVVSGVIDHHPTNQEFSYSYYRNEKASSTASMIVKGKEDEFTKDEICLAVLATMVDTVSFHSSKTLPEDVTWVKEMVHRYQLPYSQLYQEGLCLTNVCDSSDFLNHGLKVYQFGDKRIASSSVLLLHPDDYKEMYPSVFSLLQNYVSNKELEMFALIIHDMTSFCSSVYYVDATEVRKKEFDHFISRGSEVIPELEKKLYIKK